MNSNVGVLHESSEWTIPSKVGSLEHTKNDPHTHRKHDGKLQGRIALYTTEPSAYCLSDCVANHSTVPRVADYSLYDF